MATADDVRAVEAAWQDMAIRAGRTLAVDLDAALRPVPDLGEWTIADDASALFVLAGAVDRVFAVAIEDGRVIVSSTPFHVDRLAIELEWGRSEAIEPGATQWETHWTFTRTDGRAIAWKDVTGEIVMHADGSETLSRGERFARAIASRTHWKVPDFVRG